MRLTARRDRRQGQRHHLLRDLTAGGLSGWHAMDGVLTRPGADDSAPAVADHLRGMASAGRKSTYFCNRSITSDAAASDRPARRRSCGMWSSSSTRRNSGARSSRTESVTMRRTVESRRNAAITMFASTTTRRGAASDSRPRQTSRGLEATQESLLDETVEGPHVLEREHASMGQRIHPLQVANPFG